MSTSDNPKQIIGRIESVNVQVCKIEDGVLVPTGEVKTAADPILNSKLCVLSQIGNGSWVLVNTEL